MSIFCPHFPPPKKFLLLKNTYIKLFCRHVERELDRALGEKQKLLIEMEEQRAAMEEIETKEAKMKLEALQREEEIKVSLQQFDQVDSIEASVVAWRQSKCLQTNSKSYCCLAMTMMNMVLLLYAWLMPRTQSLLARTTTTARRQTPYPQRSL